MNKELNLKPRCEKCGSTLVYIRFKTSERVCRTCGHKTKVEEDESTTNTE